MAVHLETAPPGTPAPPGNRPRTRRRRILAVVLCGLPALAALACAGPRLHHRLTTIEPPHTGPHSGYTLTVYFTPSEKYYHGPRRSIREQICPGENPPDSFPADYLERVGVEGFGRTARGDHLGWDFDRHCYFATTGPPVGSHDNPLVPWQSLAANHFSPGTRIRITDCGPGVPGDICTRLKSAHWRVEDLCSIGCDDAKHLDLYIGEQTRAAIEQEDFYFMTTGATVRITLPAALR
ncbi:RlpA-like double-psi beta-barrel domain-containing protein [Streptomyces roseolilacinus]|uniref:hypothetical protein n=1 Tax=Streptomyces roseolilacinus TaxID=66904 RepID=UPI0037FCD824